MAEDSKIHTGHRRRMRSRVAENGFSSLEPHEALECLLYITNARKNTNRMAHELIDRFGDFAGVLDASEEDLMTVEGVGPATADAASDARCLPILYPVPHRQKRLPEDDGTAGRTPDGPVCRGRAGARPSVGAGQPQPGPGDALAQGRHQRPGEPCHQRRGGGSLEGRHRPGRACHNHPNGVALPSREDIQATENIVRALGLVHVLLRDHIILTETEYFSMREENRLPFYDLATGEMLRPY